MKKMRTLDTRSINTFSTRIRMFKGANASFLSLLLINNILVSWIYEIILNLIYTMETVIVKKESNIEALLNVTIFLRSKSLARNNFRIFGRL